MRHFGKLKLPVLLLGAALSLGFVSGASAQMPGQWNGHHRHHGHGHYGHRGNGYQGSQVQGYVSYGQSQGGHHHRHHHRWGAR